MFIVIRKTVVLITIFLIPTLSIAGGETLDDLRWQYGPRESQIGGRATISLPEGYVFLNAQETARFMEITENFGSKNEYLVAPTDLSWFAVFEFDAVGYVKDNESLDAESILSSVQDGTAQANIERKQRGWATLSIVGWRFKPRYNDRDHLLEWAFIARDDESGAKIVNYNTRLLGRKGVMHLTLVADPNTLDNSVSQLKSVLGEFNYSAGEGYAEYQKGDRVAEFGLAALVAGGAAAVATKKGLWAVIAGFFAAAWKFVAIAVVGLLAWIKSLFKPKS